MEALPRPEAQTPLAGIGRAVVLEAHTGLEGLEDADQAFVHRVFGEQAAREGLFIDGAGLQVAHGAIAREGLPQRGRLDAFAGGQDVGLEIEEGNIRPGQEGVHAARHHQGQQGPAKHEPVEPGQHGRDEGAVAGNKPVHRLVLTWQAGSWSRRP